MTDEELDSLNFHGTNISYAGLGALKDYVEGLLKKERQLGYEEGWDDSVEHWRAY